MTYQSVEIGAYGAPVEMYLFRQREKCWQYTSSDRTQVYAGKTYTPRTVSRSSFDRNDEAGSSTIQVRLDRNLDVTSQFVDGSTPTPVSITIFRRHRTDDETIVLFRGVVANAVIVGEEVILTCVSPLSADEKAVPRELIMRTCPHVLYGPRCSLDPTSYYIQGTLDYASGNEYRFDLGAPFEYEDGEFTAGVLMKDSTGQRGFIQKSTYTSDHRIWLLQPMAGLGVGDDVTVWYGCDRKHSTCRDKFDNIPNFGGFPLHPERNPFVDLNVDD